MAEFSFDNLSLERAERLVAEDLSARVKGGEVLRQIAIVVQPVMPEGAAKLLDQLAVPENARSFATLGAKGRLEPGTQLLPPQPVFPRHIEAETESSVN